MKPIHTITYGCVMAQAVSYKPFDVKVWVRSQVSPWGIRARQIGTGTGVIQVFQFSPAAVLPQMRHIHSFFNTDITVIAFDSVIKKHTSKHVTY